MDRFTTVYALFHVDRTLPELHYELRSAKIGLRRTIGVTHVINDEMIGLDENGQPITHILPMPVH